MSWTLRSLLPRGVVRRGEGSGGGCLWTAWEEADPTTSSSSQCTAEALQLELDVEPGCGLEEQATDGFVCEGPEQRDAPMFDAVQLERDTAREQGPVGRDFPGQQTGQR